MEQLNGKKRTVLILILGLLSAIGPFSIDMYLPGFPAIADDLNTSVDRVSYSLSSFFIGISVGQLICGPLLDRYGRKRPLYAGLLIYILASLGCAVSDSVEMLIGFRLIQAFGCCVGMVAPRAIVRDVFPVSESAKVFSLLVLILGVSPIIAPTVGSLLITALGWHSLFVVMAILTALLLVTTIFFLPESKGPDPSLSLRPKPILTSFTSVLKEPQFFTYGFAGAIAGAGLFAYLSGSPFVFMNLFGVSEQQYGWIFALIAAGLIGSSQVNSLLLKKYSSQQIIHVALVVQASVGLLLAVGSILGVLNIYTTTGLTFLFLCCQGFSFPNSAALSMAPFKKEAGSASALMGALQMGFGAFASALVGLVNNGSMLPMTGVMAGCALTGLVVVLAGQKRIRYNSRKEDVAEQALEQMETS